MLIRSFYLILVLLKIAHNAQGFATGRYKKSTALSLRTKVQKKQFNTKKHLSPACREALVRRFFGKKSFFFPKFCPFCERKLNTQNQISKFFFRKKS
jgi:uncharacterized CHY-type Zn-finger protein